jgi:hypothetical protein
MSRPPGTRCSPRKRLRALSDSSRLSISRKEPAGMMIASYLSAFYDEPTLEQRDQYATGPDRRFEDSAPAGA